MNSLFFFCCCVGWDVVALAGRHVLGDLFDLIHLSFFSCSFVLLFFLFFCSFLSVGGLPHHTMLVP